MAGRKLQTSREILLLALDPRNFVNIRTITGGPAPSIVRPALHEADADIAETESWLRLKQKQMENYPRKIRTACQQL